jgi:hypothetical protein
MVAADQPASKAVAWAGAVAELCDAELCPVHVIFPPMAMNPPALSGPKPTSR